MLIALCAGFAALDHHAAASDDEGQGRFEPKRCGPFTAALDGFSVQAAVLSFA